MPRFVPRQRKHKIDKREQRDGSGRKGAEDSNQAEIIPHARHEKAKLMSDNLRDRQPHMSAKKKKRLDKYIVWCILVVVHVRRVINC